MMNWYTLKGGEITIIWPPIKEKGLLKNEPAHDKTYNKTCVTTKDSRSPCTFIQYGRGSPLWMAVEGTCDKWSLWSDCADGQADLSLHFLHKSYCRFCRALAQIEEFAPIES